MTLFIVGMIVLRILGTAFFVLLIIRLVAGFRAKWANPARRLLEQNFASGLIDAEEFRSRRAVLDE